SIQTSTRRTAGRPWCSAAGGHDHANLALGRVELHERPLALGQQSMRRLLANSTLQSKTGTTLRSGWGREKAPPFRRRGRAISVLLWITRGLPHRKQLGARGLVPEERPRRSGASTRVISLRKEGYLGLPQLDNSAIRSAGIRFLQQRAVDARVLPWSNRYPLPNRRTL